MLGSVSDQFDESLRVVYTYCEMFSRDFVLGAKKRCMSNTSRWSPISSEHSNISLSDVALPEDPWSNGLADQVAKRFILKICLHVMIYVQKVVAYFAFITQLFFLSTQMDVQYHF